MRPLYIAREGCVLLEADFSQMEIRCLANYCHDPTLLKALESEDVHQAAAAFIFELNYDDVTEKQRKDGKTLNFAILYGMGAENLAMRRGIPPGEVTETNVQSADRGKIQVTGLIGGQFITAKVYEDVLLRDGEKNVLLKERAFKEARKHIEQYFARFPRVKQYITAQEEMAKSVGLVVSDIGRVRRIGAAPYLEGGHLNHCLRQAVNSPIQSLAADITNMTLSRITREIPGYKDWWWICNTVHDSILIECLKDMADEVVEQLRASMTQTPYAGFDVPLKVDIAVTERWGGDLDIDKLLEDDDDE
jgi:DNA polymerase-1